jgi:hypothetical protein
MVNVRLSERLWNQAKAAASQRGMTLENWVTEALTAHVQRDGGQAGEATSDAMASLAWRVSALEETIDYLAKSVGASLPGATPRGGAGAG